jgi:hypothetical protein
MPRVKKVKEGGGGIFIGIFIEPMPYKILKG